MRRVLILVMSAVATSGFAGEEAQDPWDPNYVVSEKTGRVFYCSLGHTAASYQNPHMLGHHVAGIQFALGDLEADATPR